MDKRDSGSRGQHQIEVLSDSDDEADSTLHSGRVVAVYEATGRITTRVFRSLLNRILDEVQMPDDPLPESVRSTWARRSWAFDD